MNWRKTNNNPVDAKRKTISDLKKEQADILLKTDDINIIFGGRDNNAHNKNTFTWKFIPTSGSVPQL